MACAALVKSGHRVVSFKLFCYCYGYYSQRRRGESWRGSYTVTHTLKVTVMTALTQYFVHFSHRSNSKSVSSLKTLPVETERYLNVVKCFLQQWKRGGKNNFTVSRFFTALSEVSLLPKALPISVHNLVACTEY